MKKLLLSLGTIAAIVTPVATTVSCFKLRKLIDDDQPPKTVTKTVGKATIKNDSKTFTSIILKEDEGQTLSEDQSNFPVVFKTAIENIKKSLDKDKLKETFDSVIKMSNTDNGASFVALIKKIFILKNNDGSSIVMTKRIVTDVLVNTIVEILGVGAPNFLAI